MRMRDVCAIRRISICLDGDWADDPAGAVRVLLVTPDDDFRAAALRVLERAGYAVTPAAHSGHALLACLSGPRVDLAIVEASLPETPGRDLVERMRRHHPGMQAIFLADAGSAPGPDVAVRPLTSDLLLDRIAAAISPVAS